jgi:ppGpp synthetase/RelA/SpoT-type nucleotidyltranferase
MATKTELKNIKGLIRCFRENEGAVRHFMQVVLIALNESKSLAPYVHSIKWRVKDPDHLKDKLLRKLEDARKNRRAFDITPENLLLKVNDLAGIRILHLHTYQFEFINKALLEIFDEQKYRIVEGPFARTWDDEYRAFFKNLGVKTQGSPTLYTSVHYVIESASRTKATCEIQVRTLMEEVWGEVDHAINYPHSTNDVACSEQVKVLARVTSSATRLVDSIFATHGAVRRK